MPKKAADKCVIHRIELQDTEREALNLFVASSAARNIGQGVGSVIDPFLSMTPASAIAFGGVIALVAEVVLVFFTATFLYDELDKAGGPKGFEALSIKTGKKIAKNPVVRSIIKMGIKRATDMSKQQYR